MGLAWTGEDEVDTVITAWEATAAFAADAEEAVVASLFSALIVALAQGQGSATRTRWAEGLVDANGDRCAPVVAQAVMRLASEAVIMRTELSLVANGPTDAENDAAGDGDNYDLAANLERAH